MDQAAAARDPPPGLDWYSGASRSITALTNENGPVDWTDTSDARVRRHSLPTKPETLNGVASSSTVPFPSPADLNTSTSLGTGTGTVRPRQNREQSKLRNTLSIIGETGSSHSRDSTTTETPGSGATVDDDDTSTERGSDGGSAHEEEEAAPFPADDATVLLAKSSESEPPSPTATAAPGNTLDASSVPVPPWA